MEGGSSEKGLEGRIKRAKELLKECELARGQDPYEIPTHGVTWLKIREIPINELRKKTKACADAAWSMVSLFTEPDQVAKQIKLCERKAYDKIDKDVCEVLLENKKLILNTCDVANKNALNMHHLVNTKFFIIYDDIISGKNIEEIKSQYGLDDEEINEIRRFGPNPDPETGKLTRIIEDTCLDFPLKKTWTYEREGKPILDVDFSVYQKPDERGRYARLEFFKKHEDGEREYVGGETCIWATETARLGRISKREWMKRLEKAYDTRDPNQRNDFLDEVSMTLEKATRKMKESVPLQDLFFHGVSAYGGWIETGFDPTQHTSTTVFSIFPYLERASPGLPGDILVKLVRNADPEKIRDGSYAVYLERFKKYLKPVHLKKLLDILGADFKYIIFKNMEIPITMKILMTLPGDIKENVMRPGIREVLESSGVMEEVISAVSELKKITTVEDLIKISPEVFKESKYLCPSVWDYDIIFERMNKKYHVFILGDYIYTVQLPEPIKKLVGFMVEYNFTAYCLTYNLGIKVGPERTFIAVLEAGGEAYKIDEFEYLYFLSPSINITTRKFNQLMYNFSLSVQDYFIKKYPGLSSMISRTQISDLLKRRIKEIRFPCKVIIFYDLKVLKRLRNDFKNMRSTFTSKKFDAETEKEFYRLVDDVIKYYEGGAEKSR